MTEVAVTIDVRGVAQAIANLKDLEYKARRRAVSAGVRAANAVVVSQARAAAPRRRGALAASIRGSLRLDRSTGTVIGTTGFKSTKSQKKKGWDAFYAHMVIGGTKPHVIPGKMRDKKGRKRYAVIGGHPYSRVQHPGARANPFMERVASVAFSRAVSAFETKFASAMETEIGKLPA